jgi:hypothetical protein
MGNGATTPHGRSASRLARVLWRVHVRGSVRFVDYMALRFVIRLFQVLGVLRVWRKELRRGLE